MPPPASIPQASWRELVAWFLRRRRRVRVDGPSMLPLLSPGDELLYRPTASPDVAVGDLVVAAHPARPSLTLVKRVAHVDPSGQIELLGDNPAASTDSRQLGAFAPSDVLGTVTCRFAKAPLPR